VFAKTGVPGDHHGLYTGAERVGFFIQSEKEDMKDGQMKCLHCEGRMKKATAPFHVDRKG